MLVLVVIISPFILGLDSEAVALVLRSAKLSSSLHVNISSVPICKWRTAVLFPSASILPFLDVEILKGADLHCFGTAGSSSQLKVLWCNTDHYESYA